MSQENQLLLQDYYSGLKDAYQLILKQTENENDVADYYIQLLEKFSKKKIQTILEIHPPNEESYQSFFRQYGYDVTSITLDMRISGIGGEHDGDRFIIGKDFIFPDLKITYDAVVLTHGCFGRFISITKSKQILENINNYLNVNGLLVFEFWHLPGIDKAVSDPEGHKEWEKVNSANEGSIIRLTSSKLHLDTSVLSVDIHYLIENNDELKKYNESHAWRLYTLSEIDLLLNNCDFQLFKVFQFSTFESPVFSAFRLLALSVKS